MNYVIIGNGVAGINAANAIRSRDKSSKIAIISKESEHFFSRTALMYVFCGQLGERDVEPYERDHYRRMNFRRVHDEVVGLEPGSKVLKMKQSPDINYDRLLIASGSVPRSAGWPGGDLDGVGNFVTWQDMNWMRKQAGISRKAVVAGGGLIGIEVCEVLLKAGLDVTFLVREDTYWPIALDKNESDLVVAHMKSHHCDVRLSTEIREISGKDGKVTGVLTGNDEKIDCDMAVITIGVQPQTHWLEDCGIELDKFGGIVVNDYLETNLPGIWAAGDCTSVVWFNGVRRPEQLWYTSRDQGLAAGINLTGGKKIYKRATFYNSAKFFDIEYTTAGYVNFRFEGERNWFQHEPGTNFTERITYLPDNSVIGFNMIGRRWDHRLLVRWVDEKKPLEYALERLYEALFDEEFMAAFKISSSI